MVSRSGQWLNEIAANPPDIAVISTYGFLVGRAIDTATLARADAIAATWQVPAHNVMIDLGWVGCVDYVRCLGSTLDAELAEGRHLLPATTGGNSAIVGISENGLPALAIDATAYPPEIVATFLHDARRRGHRVLLATPVQIEALTAGPHSRAMLDDATWGIGRIDPILSAAAPLARWQATAFVLLAAGCLGGCIFAEFLVPAFQLILTMPFLCVAAIRLVGLVELMKAAPEHAGPAFRAADEDLPVYSILVPLFEETDVLPRLVRSLSSLDYPAARLDIVLVLEEADHATRAAASGLDLPGNIRIIVVPDGLPRTKPKALNFALGSVRGDYVVVYDAEDRPEPGQLRQALARFSEGGPNLACVQARLNTYNPDQGFLTRQFSLEYSVLFDAILPGLERLGLPLPLGGTSNHFKAEALRAAGAWDAFNVTEDADLGIRLARLGMRTATIVSTTWEEAPQDLGNWWRQRTRWLKGWMQTYLVHMREPRRLLGELGLVPFLGLQVLMGGILISVLAHPLIYVLIAHAAWTGHLFVLPETAFDIWVSIFAAANFAIGILSSMGVGMIAVIRRGRPRLAAHALLMPIYWLMISAAGYRALVQLVTRPYHWEKTKHGLA